MLIPNLISEHLKLFYCPTNFPDVANKVGNPWIKLP